MGIWATLAKSKISLRWLWYLWMFTENWLELKILWDIRQEQFRLTFRRFLSWKPIYLEFHEKVLHTKYICFSLMKISTGHGIMFIYIKHLQNIFEIGDYYFSTMRTLLVSLFDKWKGGYLSVVIKFNRKEAQMKSW